jgi:hypothetical protein
MNPRRWIQQKRKRSGRKGRPHPRYLITLEHDATPEQLEHIRDEVQQWYNSTAPRFLMLHGVKISRV